MTYTYMVKSEFFEAKEKRFEFTSDRLMFHDFQVEDYLIKNDLVNEDEFIRVVTFAVKTPNED
tara:strand:- start:926 stop:1114 length:189 start_codon:yes stop_codon:yes gene_type:complete